jgi:hypothetical protein
VSRSSGVAGGVVVSAELDGVAAEQDGVAAAIRGGAARVPLVRDGGLHRVEIVLGPSAAGG